MVPLVLASLLSADTDIKSDVSFVSGPAEVPRTVNGEARATDGDSLRIGDYRIRLFAIDAVEGAQKCQFNQDEWNCGRYSRIALQRQVENKQTSCLVRDVDRGRLVSICRVNGVDLGGEQVRRGWAVAYRDFSYRYVPAEYAARRAKRGLWRGDFERPKDYRKRLRAEIEAGRVIQHPPSTDCNIKGNISRSGHRIYHVPGQVDYQRTRIDEKRGEKWFCTPSSAESEGWRAAKR